MATGRLPDPNTAPVTAKGDLYTYSTVPAKLAVGNNGETLVADSSTATGLKWAPFPAAGMTNPMTTTGDTIYSSSGSTPARLAIGSSGQVLTVSGGLPSWQTPSSGSLTLLSTTTLSGSTTTISSISGAYKNLYVEWQGVYGSSVMDLRLRPNGNTGTVYNTQAKSDRGSNASVTTIPVLQDAIYNNAVSADGFGFFFINDYASSTHNKIIDSYSFTRYLSGGVTYNIYNPVYIYFKDNAAITSLDFIASTGTFSAGTVRIYGVK